jgi:hypothetical protein
VSYYTSIFWDLIRTHFQHIELIWGIVPLYFALLLSELTSAKANYRTAIQTGFSFIWAAAQWLYLYRQGHPHLEIQVESRPVVPINLVVTFLVLALGALALFSGLRRRFPKYGSFLGQTRFANYFMIAIYPIQAHYLVWTWDRLAVIAIFAVPVWLVLHFGLMPLRR